MRYLASAVLVLASACVPVEGDSGEDAGAAEVDGGPVDAGDLLDEDAAARPDGPDEDASKPSEPDSGPAPRSCKEPFGVLDAEVTDDSTTWHPMIVDTEVEDATAACTDAGVVPVSASFDREWNESVCTLHTRLVCTYATHTRDVFVELVDDGSGIYYGGAISSLDDSATTYALRNAK